MAYTNTPILGILMQFSIINFFKVNHKIIIYSKIIIIIIMNDNHLCYDLRIHYNYMHVHSIIIAYWLLLSDNYIYMAHETSLIVLCCCLYTC